MADIRNTLTIASIAVALVCAGWAVYASKHSPAGNTFSAAQGGRAGAAVNAVQVVTAIASRQPMRVGIEAIGTAVANEAVSVTAKASNIVSAIRFSDGQQVKVGQVLVELDDAQARADLAAATADYTESAAQYERSRDLVASQVVSRSQYDQLEAAMKASQARVQAAEARLSDTVIRAPFTGRVGLRRVSVGTLISPGTVITTLDDVSSIKVDFSVPDVYVSELRVGQSVVARTSAYPGKDFEGRVFSVDSRVDPATRAVTVRALVPNGDGQLKPGMFLTVDLAKEMRNALVVPEEALVPEQARQYIYVVQGDSTVAKREVQIGRREPGRVEITSGVVEDDLVVIEGTLKLRDGARVSVVGPPAGDGDFDAGAVS